MGDSDECVFCHYADQSVVVYEDSPCFAVASTRPINRYHVLVIPRQHFVNFVDLPAEVAAQIFLVAKQISQAVRMVCHPDAVMHISDDALEDKGFNLVTHYKFHVIPRFLNDRVKIDWGREDDGGLQVREGYAVQIKEALKAG